MTRLHDLVSNCRRKGSSIQMYSKFPTAEQMMQIDSLIQQLPRLVKSIYSNIFSMI